MLAAPAVRQQGQPAFWRVGQRQGHKLFCSLTPQLKNSIFINSHDKKEKFSFRVPSCHPAILHPCACSGTLPHHQAIPRSRRGPALAWRILLNAAHKAALDPFLTPFPPQCCTFAAWPQLLRGAPGLPPPRPWLLLPVQCAAVVRSPPPAPRCPACSRFPQPQTTLPSLACALHVCVCVRARACAHVC